MSRRVAGWVSLGVGVAAGADGVGGQRRAVLGSIGWRDRAGTGRDLHALERAGLMDEFIVLDEWHITLVVPKEMPEAEVEEALRVLNRQRFRLRVRRAVHRLLRRYRVLAGVRGRVDH